VVDSIGDEVAQRVSDAIKNPSVELDVLADQTEPNVFVCRTGNLAQQLGEGGNDSTDWNHGQPHRTISHLGESILGILHRSAHLTRDGLELITQGNECVKALCDLGRNRRVRCSQLSNHPHNANVLCCEAS
jgi:hypothetical protein